MKKFFVILIIGLGTLQTYSQQIVDLEKFLDSLNNLKTFYQKKLSDINQEYARIDKILKQKRLEQTVGDVYFCVKGTNILVTPDTYEVIAPLPTNSKVKVLAQTDKYSKIAYNDYIGWVLKNALISEANFNALVQQRKEQRIADSIAEKVKRENELKAQRITVAKRKAELITKYGTTNAQKILDGKIWLGMTDEMARESWGIPDDINRTVGSWGVNEQWVYGEYSRTYLYFENGKLTSWQD